MFSPPNAAPTPDTPQSTVANIARDVAAGGMSAVELTRQALDRMEMLRAAGDRAYTTIMRISAEAQALQIDMGDAARKSKALLCGVPISVKDLFDIAGEVTLAGSAALAGAPPALADATAVERLKRQGAIIVGKSNMTEFAVHTLGEHAAFGRPDNPAAPRHATGGSSSGAAASVASDSVPGALATDTGGSIRVPAALCGLVGFTPSTGRVPTAGVFPLSTTFDTVGPIARTVDCCARMDAALADLSGATLDRLSGRALRLGLPRHFVLDGLDPTVARAFERALISLSEHGVSVVEFDWPELAQGEWQDRFGELVWREAYAVHEKLLGKQESGYEPETARRLSQGRNIDANMYLSARSVRKKLVRDSLARAKGFDAIVMPTTPIVAPRATELNVPEMAARVEALLGRNAEIANFFGYCAITIPCHSRGELPVGLMMLGRDDRRILSLAATVEPVVSGHS